MPIAFHIYCYSSRTEACYSQNAVHLFSPCNCMYDVFQADTRTLKLNAWKQIAYEEGM